jgi:transcriptional antiterminator RfaH
MKAWYLIQTKPRQENLAKINLDKQGYVTYLPRVLKRRRKLQRYVEEASSLFPRYLFIQLNDGSDDWGPIRSTIGVFRLVRFGHIPARVPDYLIENLKSREDTQGFQIIQKKSFKPGDKVRIVDGPLEGYEAVIFSKSVKERTVLLMKLIESYIKIEVNDRYMELISF